MEAMRVCFNERKAIMHDDFIAILDAEIPVQSSTTQPIR